MNIKNSKLIEHKSNIYKYSAFNYIFICDLYITIYISHNGLSYHVIQLIQS